MRCALELFGRHAISISQVWRGFVLNFVAAMFKEFFFMFMGAFWRQGVHHQGTHLGFLFWPFSFLFLFLFTYIRGGGGVVLRPPFERWPHPHRTRADEMRLLFARFCRFHCRASPLYY